MQPIINIAITAARRAGDIMLQSMDRLDTIRVEEKGNNDFVTEVDKACEDAIIDVIRQNYPDHGILAEESGEHKGRDEVTWIIDPLDGTTNFMHGFPHFAVSIAVKHKGRLEHGLVYDPVKQELFTASRGYGAILNDRRMRVSSRKNLKGALIGAGFPYNHRAQLKTYLASFETIFNQSAGIRRSGAAALDLAYVAAGRLDCYWEFGLKPWDVAAGSLLVSEAGGIVGDHQGGETHIETGNILAGNPKIFKTMLQALNSK